ncbi:MAG TPA: SDR family oxidoreductase [Acidobacteriaceae bacterium]|nr:SDR family oxidoreductase [Acidobacteriaceae bacterium]
MAGRLEGKSAVVAGGTGGLGRAVSLAFLRETANVIVTYRNEAEFAALNALAGDSVSRLTGHLLDVTDEAAVSRIFQDATARVDVLVNTVGAYAGGLPLWKTDSAAFERMLSLNLRAGYVLSRAIVPQMLKQGSGAIINVAARAAVDHAAGAAAYAASKAAAVAMMDCLAADLRGTGVRVNSILPSIIDTDANRHVMPGADFSKWPAPEDIASVILFLAGDEAKLIHGASIPVYGSF